LNYGSEPPRCFHANTVTFHCRVEGWAIRDYCAGFAKYRFSPANSWIVGSPMARRKMKKRGRFALRPWLDKNYASAYQLAGELLKMNPNHKLAADVRIAAPKKIAEILKGGKSPEGKEEAK
jgi:hypothetical protein